MTGDSYLKIPSQAKEANPEYYHVLQSTLVTSPSSPTPLCRNQLSNVNLSFYVVCLKIVIIMIIKKNRKIKTIFKKLKKKQ